MEPPPPSPRLRGQPFAAHFRAYDTLDDVMVFYEGRGRRLRWLLFAANYRGSRRRYYLLVPRTDAAMQTLLRHLYSSVPHDPPMLHEVIGPRTRSYDPWPLKIKVDYDGAVDGAVDAIKESAVNLWGWQAHYVCVGQARSRPSFHATFYLVYARGITVWRDALQALVDDLKRHGHDDVAAKVDLAAGAKKTMRCLFSAKPDGTQMLQAAQCAPFSAHEVSSLQQFKFSLATYFDDTPYGSLKAMAQCTAGRGGVRCIQRCRSSTAVPPAVARWIAAHTDGRAKIRKVLPAGHRFCRYYTTNWRHCANIGREHKSNNIYFVVDTQRNEIFQRCLDNETCGAFCGPRHKLADENITK